MSIQATVKKDWGAVVEDGVQTTASVAASQYEDKKSQTVSFSDVTAERYTAEFQVFATDVVTVANNASANAKKLESAGITSSVSEGAVYTEQLVDKVTSSLASNPNESTQRVAAEARAQQEQGAVIQSQDRKQYQNAPQVPFQKPEVSLNDTSAPSAPKFGA